MLSYPLRMPSFPEVHVDLGQIKFDRIYQLFLPLIPGGALVGGLLISHPASASALAISLGLGRYSRFAFLVCAVYIVGLVLYGFSLAVAGNSSLLLTWIVFKMGFKMLRNDAPSKNFVWRRVAYTFLAKSFPPPWDLMHLSPLMWDDAGWFDLYNILQDYVLRGKPIIPNEMYLLFTNLQATGWALLYLSLRSVRLFWPVVVVSVVLILSGVSLQFVVNLFYWKYDRLTHWDFTARLIDEIRKRET